MDDNAATLERCETEVKAGLKKISAMEVLCWPYEGRVWAILNHNSQVTHALPQKRPVESPHTCDDEYRVASMQELENYGQVREGIIACVGRRFYFKPLN